MATIVSILGAGPWKEVIYRLEDREFKTDYATHALCRLLAGATPVESVVIFGTAAANWPVVEKYFGPDDFVRPATDLPEGRDQPEVDAIIKVFLENIPRGRKLILDLTHGYRHQPMLLLITAFYLDLLGEIDIENAYYAMVPFGETAGEFIELSGYFSILKDFLNLEMFKSALYTQGLHTIAQQIRDSRARHFKAGDRARGQVLGEIEKGLNGLIGLSEKLKYNHVLQAVDDSPNILAALAQAADLSQTHWPPLAPALGAAMKNVETLAALKGKPLWEIFITLADTMLEKESYPSVVVLLREGWLTYGCCQISGCDTRSCRQGECDRVALRERISGTLDAYAKGDVTVHNETEKKLAGTYSKLQQIRNSISHAAIQKDPPKLKDIGDKLKGLIDEVKQNFPKDGP